MTHFEDVERRHALNLPESATTVTEGDEDLSDYRYSEYLANSSAEITTGLSDASPVLATLANYIC